VLGGLGAALNTNFFSVGCWGLSSRSLSLASIFLALAAFESGLVRRPLLMTVLAGFAVGLAVSEAADNGVIFALFFAGFVLYRSLLTPQPVPVKLGRGLGRLALVAFFAVFLTAQTLSALYGTAVKGVVGMENRAESAQQQWNWATQWSLPKAESLRVLVPGLFGYRMDTPDGGAYWGTVGQTPGWEQHGQGFARYSGSGEYAGVLVVLLALWAVSQSFRRDGSPLTNVERKLVWFWSGTAVVALLLSWGRHAPFYQFLYALPYFSTIRNPMKFMQAFHLAVMILFAYGVQALARQYLTSANHSRLTLSMRWKNWSAVERCWAWGVALTVVGSVVAWAVYSGAHGRVVNYLTQTAIPSAAAASIASFSAGEVGWFVATLAICAAAVFLIQFGAFAGPRARWAGLLLGTILVLDLARADRPWIVHYNYRARYEANNAVLELLRKNAHQHRVTMPPFRGNAAFQDLWNVYNVEWLQHQFPYEGIQSLDIPQERHMPVDKAAFRGALDSHPARLWQLTNTRYVLGTTGDFVEALNQHLDPAQRRFRVALSFSLRQDASTGAIEAHRTDTGPFALIEFTGALPRAKLYSRWQVSTNDALTLRTLAEPTFDPAQTLLVADEIAPSESAAAQAEGKVEWARYGSREVELRTSAATSTVLLLNDKFDPGWKVWVDGQPAPLLRCNFIMRGVQLPPGNHTLTLRFRPRSIALYVSFGALGVGLLLLGWLFFKQTRAAPSQDTSDMPNDTPASHLARTITASVRVTPTFQRGARGHPASRHADGPRRKTNSPIHSI
jgi:hypothetical protein